MCLQQLPAIIRTEQADVVGLSLWRIGRWLWSMVRRLWSMESRRCPLDGVKKCDIYFFFSIFLFFKNFFGSRVETEPEVDRPIDDMVDWRLT